MRDELETLIKNALNIPVFDESESIVYPAATSAFFSFFTASSLASWS